jgi:hypothetical protein
MFMLYIILINIMEKNEEFFYITKGNRCLILGTKIWAENPKLKTLTKRDLDIAEPYFLVNKYLSRLKFLKLMP